MIPGRRPTFSDSGGLAVPPFELESQVCRPTVTLGRPGTGSCLPSRLPVRSSVRRRGPLRTPPPQARVMADSVGSGPRRGAESGYVQRFGKELTGKGNLEKAEYGGAAT